MKKTKILITLLLFSQIVFAQNKTQQKESVITRKNLIDYSKGHYYKEQDSEKYTGHYYWYKFPSLSLCGFYIVNKQTKEVEYNISDFKSCEYDIEDGYSIENAKILKKFRNKYHSEISFARKKYFKSIDDISIKKEDTKVPLNSILNKTNIVFLEVVNVKHSDKLNIRELPSNKSKITLSLSNNSKSIFTDEENINKKSNNLWMKVYYFDKQKYEYMSGWVYRKYVKF